VARKPFRDTPANCRKTLEAPVLSGEHLS
jgi:hypothetical protein